MSWLEIQAARRKRGIIDRIVSGFRKYLVDRSEEELNLMSREMQRDRMDPDDRIAVEELETHRAEQAEAEADFARKLAKAEALAKAEEEAEAEALAKAEEEARADAEAELARAEIKAAEKRDEIDPDQLLSADGDPVTPYDFDEGAV